MTEPKILERWTDEHGANFEYRYYDAYPPFDNERTLMLVVTNHNIPRHESSEYMAATSFSDAFGKGLGVSAIEDYKTSLIGAYQYERDKDKIEAEREERRRRWKEGR